MRSFGATALLALAIVTECFGASDRSRQRSGPVRSVPVAADIKRDVNFDCPEEFGYYPHPTDCTLYYVCVFGGALLESCTGGLMYSHELQTCDWPRNVGCDGASAVSGSAAGGEELERLSEREPPLRTSPRRTPPPPPRAQPNPVITSRGQPKFDRDEYEKQQQLYEEVEDLPPVEEIESDRQQRVYRGQPSTIGQVQKDRDGYSSQVISSGRNFNSNIIPASISQNSGKFGSFSFGTQVDDRRTATVTPAPQSYSEDDLTDNHHDRLLDIDTNEINEDADDVKKLPILTRLKRDVLQKYKVKNATQTNKTENISKRNNEEESMEIYQIMTVPDTKNDESDHSLDDSERGKRQVRYYVKNGYNNPGKNWAVLKPIKFVEVPNYSPNLQSNRYQQTYNNANYNNYYDNNRRPYSLDNNNAYSVSNPFIAYQNDDSQSQRPFKPSIPDPNSQKLGQNPFNAATQIITKSPPISALNHRQNPFPSSLTAGFYNNALQTHQGSSQFSSQTTSVTQPNNQNIFRDSSLLPSTIVTGKPVLISTSPRTQINNINPNAYKDETEDEYDDENESEEEDDSSEEDDEDDNVTYEHRYPKPPYEFTHPSNKYADIENPFANPNFDFDAYLSKLSNGQYTTTHNHKNVKNTALKTINKLVESTTASHLSTGVRSSTLNYQGMSTPRPFSSVTPSGPDSTLKPVEHIQNNEQYNIQRPQSTQQTNLQQQQQSLNFNTYNQQQQQYLSQYNVAPQENAGIPIEAVRPKLKPPNFKDDRQLPISYSFSRPIDATIKPNNENFKGETQQTFSKTTKPYLFVTATGKPIYFTSPKQQYIQQQYPNNNFNNDKIVTQQPHYIVSSTGKPYLVSSIKPQNGYIAKIHSTPKTLTTLANQQLSALQQFWRNPSTESISSQSVTVRPSTTPDLDKLKTLFAQAIKSSVQTPLQNQSVKSNLVSTTSKSPKRRPIPKPSPEMNDYYYDDDEYYEPPVKSKYMPNSEIKPLRPPMAQNYKEYDDVSYEDAEEQVVSIGPKSISRKPTKLGYNPETATKNYNDLFIVTKAHSKDYNKNENGKIPVPVLVEYATPTPSVLTRPDITNFNIGHGMPRNRTMNIKRPVSHSGPNTVKPPKYLNQTTLRPYTVRHRLAKPTTVQGPATQKDDNIRGRIRHPNIVAQMLTTPRDSHNQETRVTQSKHDGRTNSLEPTESVAPLSYSPSPRPKMLYNGSQSYSPDQYDPFYAIYDEDGELYKDNDYVQQYNSASLRPAVQQSYRGTPPPPPPARRPVESYTPRPVSPDDYDDALIQGQITNQNQYQSAIRHSTRGEGNELEYVHNPSSVKTTMYEAATTRISTTPRTTTTSTTTQRSTTAPYTEAMTPSRYTPRSSTDENPNPKSESLSNRNSSEESVSSILSTPSIINFSSLAKPFEKTDNLHSSEVTLTTTELQAPRQSQVTNNANVKSVEVVRSEPNSDKKKYVSLTTGFSIRRNSNNTNNPYTLTVLTRPFDQFDKSRRNDLTQNLSTRQNPSKYYYESRSESNEKNIEATETNKNQHDRSSESPMRRKDSKFEVSDEFDIPVYIRPTSRTKTNPIKVKSTTVPSTSTTKYYLKSVIKRPAPFSKDIKESGETTETAVEDVDNLNKTKLQNTQKFSNEPVVLPTSNTVIEITPRVLQNDRSQSRWKEPFVSPYQTLDNLRNFNRHQSLMQDSTRSTASTRFTSTTAKENLYLNSPDKISRSKPSYFSYQIDDDDVPNQTTEVFNGKVQNVIKAFFNNLVNTSVPQRFSSTTNNSTPLPTPKVVNIGYQKKPVKYVDEKPLRHNVQRLQIITEPAVSRYVAPIVEPNSFVENRSPERKDLLSTTSTMAPRTTSFTSSYPIKIESTTVRAHTTPSSDSHQSKFSSLITRAPHADFETTSPLVETSRKFQNIINVDPTPDQNNIEIDLGDKESPLTKTNVETTMASEIEWHRPSSDIVSEIASTTSTTKLTTTTTIKIDPTTKSTIKSVSFPTRASRVNPAIKLAATNPGSGRRSYQSPSKCSSDNSLQANPKCNEIKYQRPTSTRGRGSAHYSKGGSEPPQSAPNRGTPPTRSRPTLKPSTAIVTKTTEFVDVYAHPPSRPAPVYPQPSPDKTAAKCRKDVCLLPDCYCGGKDIPGDLPVETVPQIVLLTFDDSVNDLNKGLYTDLFEKGRVNPNGCPISATFYVSHEWTDYSQVQNLYSAGHEMASHTISHSFGEQFSQKKWNREVGGQREILAAYGGVKLEDVRGMRAPFLSVGGNKMFKMLYDSNFTYDSSMPVYENRPPSWPYTLDYKLFHDCMIPPCPTKSYPGVWEVPMVMWQDLNGGRCSMGDACANPPEAEGVYKMLLKNFDRHYTTNRAPFGLFYHAAWFTQAHHKEGFIMFLDFINRMQDVWIVTNWQALQWVRDPTPISRLNSFQPFQCNYQDRPKKCNNPKVCNLWHKSGVRYMRTCQPCPEVYPWTGKTGIRSSRIDNDNGE